jgi:hypothetical protein
MDRRDWPCPRYDDRPRNVTDFTGMSATLIDL